MIQANHPLFSCTSDMYLTIYGIIFSGPFMHTDTPSGTGEFVKTVFIKTWQMSHIFVLCCNMYNVSRCDRNMLEEWVQ